MSMIEKAFHNFKDDRIEKDIIHTLEFDGEFQSKNKMYDTLLSREDLADFDEAQAERSPT
jgi:hypothetical protein